MLRLDINLLFTVINLLVLYFFAKKFLFGRVNQILEERKALIEKKFADAKTAQDTADGMKTEYEGKLAAAAGEGKEIIARAENEARLQSEKMLAAAETELEQKRRRAEETMAVERANALPPLPRPCRRWGCPWHPPHGPKSPRRPGRLPGARCGPHGCRR